MPSFVATGLSDKQSKAQYEHIVLADRQHLQFQKYTVRSRQAVCEINHAILGSSLEIY